MIRSENRHGDVRREIPKDVIAVVAAVASLLAVLLLVRVLTKLEISKDTTIVVFIFLLPLFVYLIVSGRIIALRGPGGWALEFTQMAGKRVSNLEWISPQGILVKDGSTGPEERELRLNPNLLKVVAFAARSPFFPICEYLFYVSQSLGTGAVKYVVFVDRSGDLEHFVGLLPLSSISRDPRLVPEGNCNARQLLEWVDHRDCDSLDTLDGYVGIEDAADASWSKGQCLQEMRYRGLDALPVTKDRRLIGIVERTRLVEGILADVLGERLSRDDILG